ncbi:hypothetical protein PUN28_014248 [Cardiocondyla obscurior]|uniref:Uncharacterized protein n=1 Tax=Cardiocondyla obscurior TaxID=286306 RepID=A0AAW2F528_9HYME
MFKLSVVSLRAIAGELNRGPENSIIGMLVESDSLLISCGCVNCVKSRYLHGPLTFKFVSTTSDLGSSLAPLSLPSACP